MKKLLGIFLLLGLFVIGTIFMQSHVSVAAQNGTKVSNTATYVRASHILVESEEQALRIKKDIENGDITFEAAAKKYSTCPSGANGGDLGYFRRNQMVKPFEDAAFSQNVDTISNPVKTEFGYHLIKVVDKK